MNEETKWPPYIITQMETVEQLRDKIAMKAMEGIISCYCGPDLNLPDKTFTAEQAYEYADAMLKERIKG